MKATYTAIAALILACLPASAQVPSLLNYQGRLLDTGGNPVTGIVEVVLDVYTNATNGASVYTESVGIVPVEDGVYSFNWGDDGTSVWTVTEEVATTAGSSSIFNYSVENPPILNPSVTISDGTYSWNDVAGSSSPANFLGTVSSYTPKPIAAQGFYYRLIQRQPDLQVGPRTCMIESQS